MHHNEASMETHYFAIWMQLISSIENVRWLKAAQTSWFLNVPERRSTLSNWWHLKCCLRCSDDPAVKYEIIKPHQRQRCCQSALVHCCFCHFNVCSRLMIIYAEPIKIWSNVQSCLVRRWPTDYRQDKWHATFLLILLLKVLIQWKQPVFHEMTCKISALCNYLMWFKCNSAILVCVHLAKLVLKKEGLNSTFSKMKRRKKRDFGKWELEIGITLNNKTNKNSKSIIKRNVALQKLVYT